MFLHYFRTTNDGRVLMGSGSGPIGFGGRIDRRFFEKGLICRADDRGDPVVQISPPLIAGQAEFDEMVGILGDVLSEAWQRI